MTILGYLIAVIGGVLVTLPALYLVIVIARVRAMEGVKIWESINGAGLLLGSIPLVGFSLIIYSASVLGFPLGDLWPNLMQIGIPILALSIISSIVRLTCRNGFKRSGGSDETKVIMASHRMGRRSSDGL